MKWWIWKKIGDRDFREIEIDVVDFLDKGIVIVYKGEEFELKWDEEYSLRDLKAGKSILIYIFDDDYSKAYVLPHVRDPKMESLDTIDIYRSILEKMNESYLKKKQEQIRIVEINTTILTEKPVEEITAIKEKITGTIQKKSVSEEITDLVRHYKLKKNIE